MRQRIVLATDSQEPSGVGEHMLTLGMTLAADYDVVLAAPDHFAGRSLLERGAAAGLGIKVIDLGRPRELRAWLAGLEGALLHVHAGIGWEGHDLVRMGKGAGLTVVRTEHLPYLLTDPVQQAAYRAMLLSVDGRIAVSEAVFDSFKHQGKSRLAIVRNGALPHAPTASRAAVRAELGLGESAHMLLTVARLAPQKGHSTLIEAAPAVLERFSDTRFVLVGTGPDADAIAAQIETAGLGDRFLLLGQRDDVADLLAAADLFVLPSLFEGLPLALLEALAARLPVVASGCAATSEVLGSEYPFLAEPGDAAALSRAIIDALSDPEWRQQVANAASERFDQRFSAARMAAQTSQFYQSILHKRGARGLKA